VTDTFGGCTALSDEVSSADIYDPATSTFAIFGPMTEKRTNETVVLLDDGKVLIAGGRYGCCILKTAEVFDPVTGSFTRVGDMGTYRNSPTMLPLPDGRALVVGGLYGGTGTCLNTTEIYDPTTRTFGPGPIPNLCHYSNDVKRLPDGRFLILGSGYPTPQAGTEIFDPTTMSFAMGPSLATVRSPHTAAAVVLATGDVLITGGALVPSGGTSDPTEFFDFQQQAFRLGPPMSVNREFHSAVLLPDGRILVIGGDVVDYQYHNVTDYLNSTELFVP
jgi:hypothetical protein